MILLNALIGVVAGIAGHQTNGIYEQLEENGTPVTWIRFSRYGTGYLISWVVFSVGIARKPWGKEASFYSLMAGVMVGVGTMIGYFVESRR